MRIKDLNRFGLAGLRVVEAIMTIPFNSFNKEYLKQYLSSPTSRRSSHVGRLNLSNTLGLKSRLIKRWDMKD